VVGHSFVSALIFFLLATGITIKRRRPRTVKCIPKYFLAEEFRDAEACGRDVGKGETLRLKRPTLKRDMAR